MLDKVVGQQKFRPINLGYQRVFTANQLSLGLVVPIDRYSSDPVPNMERQVERIQLAEQLGFTSVWLRDVPFNVPSFGDAGQLYDPFVYLGLLSAETSTIALGIASLILPLRHPAHVAKAAASVDALSGGRLLLGIASGDRPEEYPALNIPYENRGDRFRQSYHYLRDVLEINPEFESECGRVSGGMDMLPKPHGDGLPLLITGSSQQSPGWVAKHGDGWMTYPRPAVQQQRLIERYRARIVEQDLEDKPVMEPLYIDLHSDPEAAPVPIHLGLSLGVHALHESLESRQAIGVNHVALNLRFNQAEIEESLNTIASKILPSFDRRF